MHPLPGNAVNPGEFGCGEPPFFLRRRYELRQNAERVIVEVQQKIEESGKIGGVPGFLLLLRLFTGDVAIIGEIGRPLRDAVEILPADRTIDAGFGFGAEAAGGCEFALPPALIEFSPALRRLFHTENPLDFQYSAVSGTINRKHGLFCKNLAFLSISIFKHGTSGNAGRNRYRLLATVE